MDILGLAQATAYGLLRTLLLPVLRAHVPDFVMAQQFDKIFLLFKPELPTTMPRLRRRPYLSVVAGFKTLKSHLALLKLPIQVQVVVAGTKRVYYSVTQRQRRTTSSTRAQQQDLEPARNEEASAGLDRATSTRFPIPNRILHTHTHLAAATLGSGDPPPNIMIGEDRSFAFDDHLVISNSELVPEKAGMAFPDLLPVRRCRTLGFTFNVQASPEPVVYVEEVVESDEDDEFTSKTTVVEVEEESDGGYERDGDDAVPVGIVKYDLDYQPRAHATKTDANVAEISSEDRHIGSPSYQITPRQNGFRDCMQRRSDDIQTAARLHAVEQQLKAPSTATRQEEEHPEPIWRIRPAVLSGLGRSTPLRSSWTISDV